MNPVTFNNSFLPFIKKVKLNNEVLNTPLIHWNAERLEVPTEEKFSLRNPDGNLRLPFPAFRVFGRIEFKDTGAFKLAVFPHFNTGGLVCLMAEAKPTLGRCGDIIGCIMWHKKEGKSSLGSTAFQVLRFCSGKLDLYKYEDMQDDYTRLWVETAANSLNNDLQLLVADFLNPHLHLCKKAPQIPKGHSVVWQKAREHYVLIHKTHPANNKTHIGKPLVSDGPLIDRCAHSRRAHFRLLKSPRFTKKSGSRIWVRSAWVGPKEWTDRSGQIYRIVER